ncbi:hypothetical protein ACWED2_32295 [Amycolatopsis sp. NPDC005003]
MLIEGAAPGTVPAQVSAKRRNRRISGAGGWRRFARNSQPIRRPRRSTAAGLRGEVTLF